ncbi:hypothetical protein BKH43_03775 [Helicobacter sp. 13S00401-1]|uniref:hypothetical protein n=1 Tax=Helicobacter sp. 13S00401-1 TaxID=1905758 RepID=UPI000BA6316A|nr:hypothetical protein [Helicobacter sp. 13S00401-1]PAF50984.1 hypothetical protein BKH43_03775 [Helicobacter sp. 13S00401-1]
MKIVKKKTKTYTYNYITALAALLLVSSSMAYADTRFYVQAGGSVGLLKNDASLKQINGIQPGSYFYNLKSLPLPIIQASIGLDQRLNLPSINLVMGVKIELGYGLGFIPVGDFTNSYKMAGADALFYIGAYRFKLYPFAGIGYERINQALDITPFFTGPILEGMRAQGGFFYEMDDKSAVSLAAIFSKNFEYKPRLSFNYEFKF